MLNAIISAFALGQCLLTATLLARRIRHYNVYLPLALLFAANAIVQLCFILREPVFDGSVMAYQPQLTLFKLLVELTLPPLLWIYVRELTSKFARGWRRTDIYHFVYPVLPCLAVGVVWFFIQGRFDAALDMRLVEILNAILNLAALGQYIVYTTFVILRLSSYRRKLMDLFASTTNMELRWFRWFMVLVVITILLEISSEILSTFFDVENPHRTLNGVIRAVIVWFFAIWGLRQRPDLKIEVTKTYPGETKPAKYEKSAMTPQQIDEVTEKIVNSVEKNKMYQDPNLSLRILSDEIAVLPNYVSQALNTKMRETFFDYVNRLRVQDAMERLKSTDDTVLAIASNVGFNSRSSFYSAFKKVTGKTPTAYRKEHASL